MYMRKVCTIHDLPNLWLPPSDLLHDKLGQSTPYERELPDACSHVTKILAVF